MYVNYSIIEFVIFIVQFVEILFIFQGGRLCCVREIFYLYNKIGRYRNDYLYRV